MLHTVLREERTSFDPEITSAMAAAYEAILIELGLSERDDAGTRLVAKRVIEFASQGERDPERLKIATLAALNNSSRRQARK
jgi:hypothetical protein